VAGKRILIVDDQIEMLRMIGMNLEAKGYQIEAAQDAPGALERINRALPDLLILDIMLPGISGADLLRQLREDPKTKNLPVIILSALSQVDDKIAGLEAGADEYLTKPIDVRELIARVAAVLARSERLRQAGEQARGQVITFLAAMGGVGTTTLTLNTAAALARAGPAVIALSLDPSFGSFKGYLGHHDSEGLADLFESEPTQINRDTLRRALIRHPSGIRVLAVPPDLARPTAPTAEAIGMLLEAAVQDAGFITVDLRPLANESTRAVLERSHQVLLIAEPTPACLDAAKLGVEYIQRWATMASRIACILVNRSSIAASLLALDVQRELGVPVLASVPQAADALASAYRKGQLILFDQPEHPVAETIRGIAAVLAQPTR